MTEASERARDDIGDPSLVRGDLLYRLQRRIGLIPAEGLGVGRRAVLLALLAWLPIAIWAVAQKRAFAGAVEEPLLQHYGVSVSCLIGIPLLVLAEALVHLGMRRIIPQFVESGAVPESERDRFAAVLRGVQRLRDHSLPWILIFAIVAAWSAGLSRGLDGHELLWAADATDPARLGFGGVWFLFVARPLYLALLLGWIWRLALLGILLRRIAGLDLSLVPTHPDRAGGLGFLDYLPPSFALVPLAIGAVLASRWAHGVVYHDHTVASLRAPAAAFALVMAVVFLAPFLAFGARMRREKRQAALEYGALVSRHGRLVRRRWILGEPVTDDEILNAPELGPVADTAVLYEGAARMRSTPIGRRAVAGVLLPAILPLLPVFAIEVPIRDLAKKLLQVLL